jgi:hypothetical protein
MRATHTLFFLASCLPLAINGHKIASIPTKHHKLAFNISAPRSFEEKPDLILRDESIDAASPSANR